jgi:hypothetical protein
MKGEMETLSHSRRQHKTISLWGEGYEVREILV